MDVDLLDRACIVVAQHTLAPVYHHLDRALAFSFQQPAVNARQPYGVDPLFLQRLDDTLVHLAAVHHHKDVKRAPVGAAADIARNRGHKLGGMSQLLGDHVSLV